MARRLNVPALGIAVGVVFGVVVLLTTWLNWLTGGAERGWFGPCVRALDAAYPGYGSGFFGGIWGGILGFVDGLILGGAIALIYNRLATPADEQD